MKRIHEYKRQFLNVLGIIWRYDQIKKMSPEQKAQVQILQSPPDVPKEGILCVWQVLARMTSAQREFLLRSCRSDPALRACRPHDSAEFFTPAGHAACMSTLCHTIPAGM